MPAGTTAHAQSTGTAPQTASAPPNVAGRRRVIAVVIAIAWCVVLACLVLTSANPVTLNRRQFLEAAAVVTAQVVDLQSGSCRVSRQWTGAPLADEIVVERLIETSATPDGEWILPLEKHGDRLDVVPSRLPSGTRLVYPATPDVVRQLETLVEDQQRR